MIDFDFASKRLGYENEYQMFEDLYKKKHMSTQEIGDLIGASRWTIGNNLRKRGFQVRGVGGPNNCKEKGGS